MENKIISECREGYYFGHTKEEEMKRDNSDDYQKIYPALIQHGFCRYWKCRIATYITSTLKIDDYDILFNIDDDTCYKIENGIPVIKNYVDLPIKYPYYIIGGGKYVKYDFDELTSSPISYVSFDFNNNIASHGFLKIKLKKCYIILYDEYNDNYVTLSIPEYITKLGSK